MPQAVGRTHVGKVREINEDRYLVRSERGLWAVADGMGGHCAGGQAADIAIDELRTLAEDERPLSDAAVRAALERANQRIRRELSRPRSVSGTTVVVAWLEGLRLSVFWAGDSRAYLFSGEGARCLTRDHSVVQELLDAGEIDAEQAGRHPHANLVTRALGADDRLVLDKVDLDLVIGDRFILCSDGISRSLDHSVTPGGIPVAQFADSLLADALQRDGSDNATLVAIEVGSGRDLSQEDELNRREGERGRKLRHD
jgi:serine/threonine protein phosphatase PrpC